MLGGSAAVQDQGDGSIVAQGDLHVGLKHAAGDRNVPGASLGNELLVQLSGDRGRSGGDEAGTFAFATVAQECELADDQQLAANVLDGEIHFVVGIREDAEPADLVDQVVEVLRGVALLDSQQHDQAVGDGADTLVRDDDLGMADALNNRFHDVHPVLNEAGP